MTSDLILGNRALKEKSYVLALKHYRAAIANQPELTRMIKANIHLVEKKLAYNSMKAVDAASKKQNTETIDIVVPVYNALDDVKLCLQSLMRHTDGFEVRVLVINDGSDESTTQWLRDFCAINTQFHLIEHPTNKGYTCAVNTGLRASTANYVITQNSDTIVSNGWLIGLYSCINSSPTIGIVGPLSNAASWQNVPNLRDAEGNFAINKLPENYTIEEMAIIVRTASSKIYPLVPFVNGFCFMIKREVIHRVGFMDEENFPIGYGEEDDYCIRALDLNYDLAVADDVYVYHSKSKSFGHQKRVDLSKSGGDALRRKHTKEKVNYLIESVSKSSSLKEIRSNISNEISRINLRKRSAFRSVLFVLPAGAGGGGAHSIIQEAAAMRKLGIAANVAVEYLNKNEFLNVYKDVKGIEELLLEYHRSDNLEEQIKNLSFAKGYQIIVATIYNTVSLVKLLTDRFLESMPAYYVQDYEPYFFEEGSEEWRIAYDSYSLMPNALMFAKTKWIADKIKYEHGVDVQKVAPSIDHNIYHRVFRKRARKIVISAMIRPSSKRRGAERTMRVLSRIANIFGDHCIIRIFGCSDDELKYQGLEDNFKFYNSGVLMRPQVATILGLSDIFLDLSDYQAFGRTALEAMACGATALVPEHGGSSEYAIDNKNAIVVDTQNEELIIKK